MPTACAPSGQTAPGTYEYVYLDGLLVKLTVNDAGTEIVMYFSYDASGTPTSILYDGTTYYYVTNLQGDVVGIVNQNGNIRVSYTYDAWGNLLSTTGGRATTVGKYNPLRYRGYVYDRETGLYYLQSRYYDPEVGRFINADAFASTGQGVLGNNMFAYCGNSPIMRIDESGYAWKWWENFWNDVKDWLKDEKEEAKNNVNVTTAGGITASGAFGVEGSVSVGLTSDTKGNIGIAVTTNGGGGFPSAGVGQYLSCNNAPTIYHQSGLGAAVGASGGPYVAAIGGEYNMIIDQSNGKVYHGGTVSVTYGLYPTVLEVHGEAGYTWVWGINIYDKAIQLIDSLFL